MEKKTVILDTNIISSSFSAEHYREPRFHAAKLSAAIPGYDILITPFTFYELLGDFQDNMDDLCFYLCKRNIGVLAYKDLSIDPHNPFLFFGCRPTIIGFLFSDITELFGRIAFSFLDQTPGYSSFYEDTELLNKEIQEMEQDLSQANRVDEDPKKVIRDDVYPIFLKFLSRFFTIGLKRRFSEADVSGLIFQNKMVVKSSFLFQDSNESEQRFVCNAILDKLRNQKDKGTKPSIVINDLIDYLNAHVAFQKPNFYFLTFDKHLCDYMLAHQGFISSDEKQLILAYYSPASKLKI